MSDKKTKKVPQCPTCHLEMAKVGTMNRGELKPKRVFQCMVYECPNVKRYFRDGTVAK